MNACRCEIRLVSTVLRRGSAVCSRLCRTLAVMCCSVLSLIDSLLSQHRRAERSTASTVVEADEEFAIRARSLIRAICASSCRANQQVSWIIRTNTRGQDVDAGEQTIQNIAQIGRTVEIT